MNFAKFLRTFFFLKKRSFGLRHLSIFLPQYYTSVLKQQNKTLDSILRHTYGRKTTLRKINFLFTSYITKHIYMQKISRTNFTKREAPLTVYSDTNPANISWFNVSNRNIRKKWNMFRVNKNTKTTSITLFWWFFFCQLWTYLTPIFSVFIVDFEQANVSWEACENISKHLAKTSGWGG